MTHWLSLVSNPGERHAPRVSLILMKHFSPLIFCLLGGSVIYLLSALWIIVHAFRRNFFLGCVCFVFPVFRLVYVATNWRESRWAFFMQLGAYVLILLAVFAGLHTRRTHTTNP